MSFKSILTKLFSSKVPPAHLPYTPTPPLHHPDASSLPNQFPDNSANTDTVYMEAEANMHGIAGTNIAFGTQKLVQVDSRGQAKDLSQTQSHIVGSGKIVTQIEDLFGVCPFCQAESKKAFEDNLITLEQAQVKSLYDVSSASRCDNCGTDTCCRHTRPIQMPDGLVQLLCVDCQKKLKWKTLRNGVFSFLLSPFKEDENPTEEQY